MRSSALPDSVFATHTTDIITILDENQEINFLNPAFYLQTGFGEIELAGTRLPQLIHPDDWHAVQILLTQAERNPHQVQRVTIRFRKKEGGYLTTASTLATLPEDDPRKRVIITSKASPALSLEDQSAAQKLAIIAQYPSKAIVITDRAGITEWVNEGFTHLTGYTLAEVIGRTPGSLLQGPLTNPAIVSYMRQAIREGKSFSAETVNYRKDSTPFFMQTEVSPIRNQAGQVTHFMGLQADVTERKRLQEQLSEQLTILHSIQDSFSGSLFAVDTQLRYISCNAAHRESMQRLFGVAIQPGMPFLDLLDTSVDSATVREQLGRALQGKPFTVRHEMERPAENKNYFEVFYNPIHSKEGEITGVVVLASNITRQVKAEQERDHLLHELMNYKQVLDKSTLVSIFDLQGNIMHVNELVCSVSQFSREELLGRHYGALNGGVYPESFFEDIHAVISQGKLWRGEICNRAKEGSLYWVETVINPVTDESGYITRYIAIHHEITERKKTEEKIRLREAALRVAQEVARTGSWEYDAMQGQMHWSDEIFRIYGLDPQRGVPSPAEMQVLFHLEDWPECYELTIASLEQGKPHGKDFRIVTPQGIPKHLQIITRPAVEESGLVSKVYGTVMDVTDLKSGEEHLQQQNEELRKINAQLDDFVYSVSHDLKAPLASITGLINIALLEENFSHKNEYMELMRKSVTRLDNFIRDLIDFARNSRMVVTREEIALGTLLGEIRQELSHSADGEYITWIIEITEEAPFYSDVTRLSVILNNLLSNAVRYSDPRKENPSLEVSAVIRATRAYITIADNGIGIAQEHLDKIFNMFYRATEYKPGSGLGLFIVKETVAALGGTIEVESAYGEGTTFTIELPNQSK